VARPRPTGDAPTNLPADDGGYTVVARRYRPQTFSEVVGQDHVVQALRNAISLNRVTHAYLFSGTRGVGKTSVARIFAKCLNCVNGPTVEPDNTCDICRAISVGQDVDVIEIDGASNNGVEAVRELRQNAGLRPSRARFKIYYIDEVHMLSTGAFNALLKTLEEPPEHVKFFFATTEPNKIPITVLSRCQRYDFAGITPDQIVATLAQICAKEHVSAETDALATIARRAGGSMRDAQSLLEQMLSYGDNALTSESVHRALGIAPDERILDLIDALADKDEARVLGLVEDSSLMGVQPADLLSGTLDFLRDVMVTQVGPSVPLLAAAPSQQDRLRAVAARWPLDTILAAFQVLDQAKRSLRGSSYGRMIVEFALVRVARLEDFDELGELIGRLGGTGGPPPVKKKLTPPEDVRPRPTPPPPVTPPVPLRQPEKPLAALDLNQALAAWRQDLGPRMPLRLGMTLSRLTPSGVEPPGVLVVPIPSGYNGAAEECEAARGRIETTLGELLGRPVSVRFDRVADSPIDTAQPSSARTSAARTGEQLAADPFVRDVMQIFETPPFPYRVEHDEASAES
jgi:DNA polymerase-3 subunit gamma/tau